MRIDKGKLRRIIAHFGKLQQVIKLGEEVGELFKAILNYENGITRTNNEITNEIADCYVLLKQMEMIYKVDKHELQQVLDMKVDRVFVKYNVGEQ